MREFDYVLEPESEEENAGWRLCLFENNTEVKVQLFEDHDTALSHGVVWICQDTD